MANEQAYPAPASQARGPALNWGICGAAIHARKFMVEAIRNQGGRIVAIGASTGARAEAFARELDIPQAIEGYAGVLSHPEVEAVYLPLMNTLHFEWALACARAGKHCLCEKPLVLSLREARELRQAFAGAGRCLVEAFMWRHHPHTTEILRLVRDGELGDLRRFHAMHGYMVERDRREGYRYEDVPGSGVLWDIGTYLVNAARLFFAAEPVAVSARTELFRPGSRADCSAVGWLDFGENRLATIGCSYTSAYRQEFVLVGSKGSLQVTRPLTNLSGPTLLRLDVGGQTREYGFEPVNPYVELVDHFSRAVRDPAHELAPAEDGVGQAAVMEALASSAAQGGAPHHIWADSDPLAVQTPNEP